MFNLIAIILNGIVVFFAYRQGLKDGRALKDNRQVESIIPHHIKLRKKMTKKEKEENRKLSILLDNINNYNGGGLGQKEVK